MVVVIVRPARSCGSSCLLSLPLRLALLEEGAHALLGVGEGGVEGHDLLGVRVRLLDGHFDLAVKSLLANPHDERAGIGDLLRQLPRLRLEFLRRHDPVDQSLGEGLLGGDEGAGEEHLHRLFLAYRAAQRYHRGRAEQPDLYPRSGEARLLRGDDEVACGGELTTRSGGYAVDLRYDRLGDGLHRLHQLAADVEDMPVRLRVAPDHLGEVVTCAERRTVACEEDYVRLFALPDGLQAVPQLLHVGEGEGVAFVGTVHRDAGYRAVRLEKDVLVGLSLCLDHRAILLRTRAPRRALCGHRSPPIRRSGARRRSGSPRPAGS